MSDIAGSDSSGTGKQPYTRKHGAAAVRAKIEAGRAALAQYTFRGYFFFVVILVGGLGVWIPIAANALGLMQAGWRDLTREVGTCLVAIVCSGATDLILTDQEAKSVKLTAQGLMLLCVLALVGTYLPNKIVAITSSIVGGGLALFAWVIANADNSKLSDEPPPTNALGGSTDQLAGSTQGMRV